MDRRSFLRGTFGGVAAGGILIAAADTDLAAFAAATRPGTPLEAVGPPEGPVLPQLGHVVFNSDHQPIGVIERMDFDYDKQDVTPSNAPYRLYAPGMLRATASVVIYGNVNLLVAPPHQRTK